MAPWSARRSSMNHYTDEIFFALDGFAGQQKVPEPLHTLAMHPGHSLYQGLKLAFRQALDIEG
jgi:hypothetical protein